MSQYRIDRLVRKLLRNGTLNKRNLTELALLYEQEHDTRDADREARVKARIQRKLQQRREKRNPPPVNPPDPDKAMLDFVDLLAQFERRLQTLRRKSNA